MRKGSRSSRPPRARGQGDRRAVARELRQVLKVQRESGEAMRRVRVPITTEPAPVFKL